MCLKKFSFTRYHYITAMSISSTYCANTTSSCIKNELLTKKVVSVFEKGIVSLMLATCECRWLLGTGTRLVNGNMCTVRSSSGKC